MADPKRVRAVPAADRYDAFISYSHTLDGAIAQQVQRGVEGFAKPWYQPRALRVFRDVTNLTANPGLWASIENALAASRWLVLMASPAAARSDWVGREVSWWLSHRSAQRILVVLTEGEFRYRCDAEDDDAGEDDDAALPAGLREAFVEEPRWVDLRWLRESSQVDSPTPGCASAWPTSRPRCARSRRTCWWASTSGSTGGPCC
jgi:hypothetical protein